MSNNIFIQPAHTSPSDAGIVMDGDSSPPSVCGRRNESAPGDIDTSEKSLHICFTADEGASTYPARDLERGGVKPAIRRSSSSPFFWLFLSWVSAEAGGLIYEYLQLTVLFTDSQWEKVCPRKVWTFWGV